MPNIRVVTGSGSGTFTAEIQGLEDLVAHPEGLLNKLVDAVVMPALRRNWDNAGIKSHGGISSGRAAVCERNAVGNVVGVYGNTAEVTYDQEGFKRITALIRGRREVFPKRARWLVFNQQYAGEPHTFHKKSAASKEHALYYLTPADEESMKTVAETYIAEQMREAF